MKKTLLSVALLCLLCASASTRVDAPLKWKIQRWQYIVIVQGGDQVGDNETKNTEKKIITVLRGKQENFPKFQWWRHKNHAKGQYYLMCYHKAPPGTSAWGSFNLDKTKDGFTILNFHTDHDTELYSTKAEYKDMTLDKFEELLKQVPFEPDEKKTYWKKRQEI